MVNNVSNRNIIIALLAAGAAGFGIWYMLKKGREKAAADAERLQRDALNQQIAFAGMRSQSPGFIAPSGLIQGSAPAEIRGSTFQGSASTIAQALQTASAPAPSPVQYGSQWEGMLGGEALSPEMEAALGYTTGAYYPGNLVRNPRIGAQRLARRMMRGKPTRRF